MFIVTLQAPVPEHAPLQPAKAEPVAGMAVSVTVVWAPKPAEHVPGPGHVIRVGLLVTVPFPLKLTISTGLKLSDLLFTNIETFAPAFDAANV